MNMPTQDIEQLIATLQKGQQELARRDHEHDEHITILLGQVVTLLPEVRDMRLDITRIQDRLDEMYDEINKHTDLLHDILDRLPERK
jgi:ABC-type transporter Mla subunit MlaD